jgi:hypothetical protein
VLSVSLSSSGSVVSVRLLVCAISDLSVKLWVYAVGQNVGLCCRSSCGTVLSVMLWVCVVGKSVGKALVLCCRSVSQTVGLISVTLWVCAIGQCVCQAVCL